MSIQQPADASSNGVSLIWNKNLSAEMNAKMKKAQKFVDSECIRLMKPYTPFMNGVLEKSATIGTVIGSGEIHQNAPYARYQYYGMLMVSSVTGSSFARNGESKVLTDTPLQYNTFRHPQAGKMWFERMKADHKKDILAGAAQYAGGKSE